MELFNKQNKKTCYRNLGKHLMSFENYKLAKKEVNKAMKEARAKVY